MKIKDGEYLPGQVGRYTGKESYVEKTELLLWRYGRESEDKRV